MVFASPFGVKAQSGTAPAPLTQDACLACHSQPGLSTSLPDGTKLPLYVNPTAWADSVHGGKLVCSDCHNRITSYPHPKFEAASRREYTLSHYELCRRCHFANYTKTLDSVHYDMLSNGDQRAPVCTDCHSAHQVVSPNKPRSRISQTCAQCHSSVSAVYTASAHGKALMEENNQDVPVCTDCHRTHNIEDPRTPRYRFESVEICARCHSNEKLMQKYGLSTQVLSTYLQDFHGATVALLSKESKDIWPKVPVCTDCHGVHDISKVHSPSSPVLKANLANTCRKCHPEATEDFPSAWLSHYEPSPQQAPLVYYIRWFYRIFIPFIVVGLSVHILLDLWRVLTNR